ncbi:unnamed protein product [Protopolystoma xenopodis]|uniref:Amino acid transporter n=1 Tax=Protopolystoma xenopodis TaxID=117903 RepID=A0A3S5FFP2_9PLAT|nr:unnamed protein product [Protopolystoma xenopodis]
MNINLSILTLPWGLNSCSDRIRTSINVLGDAIGAGIVHHLCAKELAAYDAEAERELDEIVEDLTRKHSHDEAHGFTPGRYLSANFRFE